MLPRLPLARISFRMIPGSGSSTTFPTPGVRKMLGRTKAPSPNPKGTSGFGTVSVAVAATPTVISTFISHILTKPQRSRAAKRRRKERGLGNNDHTEDKPTDDITYKEGLEVVRRFIDFSSHHGVEEVQAFTAMKVPNPSESQGWVEEVVGV
jgi:hypothetical protein